MEAENDRFSIRDYAAKIRIVDLAKSWPFVSQTDEKPHLPPISIRRFRWWADELSAARSVAESVETKAAEAPADDLIEQTNEIIEYPSPKSPSTKTIKKTTEVEELRSPKTKARSPKKRSIIELFASAPQIETAAAAVDQSNGEDGDGEGKEEEEKVMTRKRKGKRKKGTIKMEIRASKMDKDCKPKMISSHHSHLLQDPTNTKAHRNTAECVVESKKFAKVKILQKKHNILQTLNPLSRNQKVVKKLPARSILKNKNRFSSARKKTEVNNAKTVKSVKRYCKTSRHVTFSEEDDILGHSNKCSSIDLPQLKSLCKIFSDVLTKSSVMNNSSKVHELPGANDGPQVVNASEEDTNVGVVDRTDESSSQKNNSSDSLGNVDHHKKLVNSSNSSCSIAEKASMAVMIDLNHAIDPNSDLDYFNPSTENKSPSCTNSGDLDCKGTTHRKGSSTSTEFHLQRGLPNISLATIQPSEGNFVSASNVADLLATMKNPSQHSSQCCLIACNEKNEKQCQHYFNVDMNCSNRIPENQSERHCSPKDLLSNNICHSMGSNKFCESVFLSNSVSNSRSKSTGEDFIGFPVNKQGELIQLLPGTKFILPYMKQNMELDSSHGFYTDKQVEHDINVNPLEIMKGKDLDAALYQNDQLDYCPNQYHPASERRYTEFIGTERFNIQNNEPVRRDYTYFHSHANKTKLSFDDGEIGDATIDFFKKVDLRGQRNSACQIEPVVQPTIRLMGQDIVVGGSNRDCHSSIMPENYLSKQRTLPEFVAKAPCGSSTGNLLELPDPPPSILYHTSVEPQFDSHIDDHVSESLSRKNIFSNSGNNIFKVGIDGQAVPHKTFLKKTDKFIRNSLSKEESMKHQYYPTIASCQQNIQQKKPLSSSHCNHGQDVSCSTFLTPSSLRRYKVHENPFQSVQIQASENPPQWLHQANHQERNQLPSSSYSCQIDLSQQFRFSGTDLSPYNMPMVPFSIDNISPRKTSTFAPNSNQSSIISVVTATNSMSEVSKTTVIKNKEGEGSYCNFTGFNGPVDAHKFLKRPAGRGDVLMNSAKRPRFEKQANYSIPVESQGANLMRDLPFLDNATAMDFQKAVNEVDESSNAASSSFSRSDKESAVGVTKLVAAAKHALKPNQKIDEGNFRSVHPITDFPCNASNGKFLSPHKQIAKATSSDSQKRVL